MLTLRDAVRNLSQEWFSPKLAATCVNVHFQLPCHTDKETGGSQSYILPPKIGHFTLATLNFGFYKLERNQSVCSLYLRNFILSV